MAKITSAAPMARQELLDEQLASLRASLLRSSLDINAPKFGKDETELDVPSG